MSPRYAVSFDLPTHSPATPAALQDFDFDQAL
jgi:hypothetical protein